MRWKSKEYKSYRTVKRFAWLPVKLDNGMTIWLEKYKTDEEFIAWPGCFFWNTRKIYQENNRPEARRL